MTPFEKAEFLTDLVNGIYTSLAPKIIASMSVTTTDAEFQVTSPAYLATRNSAASDGKLEPRPQAPGHPTKTS